MMKKWSRLPASVLALFIFGCHTTAMAQSAVPGKDSLEKAAREGRPVLLVFSGSDWCEPCRRIDKNIFADSSYRQFEAGRLVRVTADFPQRLKQHRELVAWNDSLAERYNPDGHFPLLLLLDPHGRILSVLPYEGFDARQFVSEIKKILRMNNLLKEYSRQTKQMGSDFGFVVTASSPARGMELLDRCEAEVNRIENLLSEFKAGSETSLINRHAGIQPVTVSRETYDLLSRCQAISRITGGAFDITAARLKKLYRFNGGDGEPVSEEAIAMALSQSGFKRLHLLDGFSVFAEVRGMHINFAAIGKGYAADSVRRLMKHLDVGAGLINASGDISCWGLRPCGAPWRAGIASPREAGKMLMYLPLHESAIATSGDYIQFFRRGSRKYGHTIDPRSGKPVTGLTSVSVISPSAEWSDALATAITVLGKRKGLKLLENLPRTHALLIDEQNHIYPSHDVQIQTGPAQPVMA